MNPPPVQTSEPSTLTRHGITIRKRNDSPGSKYITRIRFRGKVHELTLADTAKDSFDIAVRARREIHAGRWAELRAATALRQDSTITIGQLFTTYRLFEGPDRPSTTTRDLNINALTAVVREALGATTDVEKLSLARITRELLWQWKETKRQTATVAAGADDDERAQQILRSANSRMRQARSLFADSEDLRTFYRMHKIEIPAAVAGFKAEPLFGDVAKEEYHAPHDQVISNTFAALEILGQSTNPDDLNMFKACWLALGFGLRAGDIRNAKNSWFEKLDGIVFIRGDKIAKNKKFAEVRVQLGAWSRISPLIEGQDQNAHVLTGTMTERCDSVFRRISEWMRSLGWETTHHLHELRAWAGCQIAMAAGGRGLLDAQVFMRHGHYQTTEKYYGHHIKIRLQEVQLTIPSITPKTFQPQVLPDAATGHAS